MDMNMLATDVEKALDMLPPQLVVRLLNLVMQHAQVLSTSVPAIVKLLAPHFNAGALEHTAGLLTTEELAAALLPVLQRYVMVHASAG